MCQKEMRKKDKCRQYVPGVTPVSPCVSPGVKLVTRSLRAETTQFDCYQQLEKILIFSKRKILTIICCMRHAKAHDSDEITTNNQTITF